MSTMAISSNGVGLLVQVGRQGPTGPAGPPPPSLLSFNVTGDGAGQIQLCTLPAFPIGGVGAQLASGYIVAQDQVSGDSVVWQLVIAVVRGADGTLAFPGNPADGTQATNPGITLLIGDSSMLGCTLTPVLDANALEIDGAGLAGRTIQWTGSLTIGGNLA